MTCCAYRRAANAQFGTERARGDLNHYRRRGPDNTTRLLLAAIRSSNVRGATLLDIGAGIGVIHHELLGAEVAAATHVDAAAAYLLEARAEAERRGHQATVQFVEGDFVEVSAGIPAADVVTLDRVICCYPDVERLVRCSADKARRLYAFSLPHDRWDVRVVIGIQNLIRRLVGSPFRTFVHPVAAVERVLAEMGFRRRFSRRTFVWLVALYARDGGA